MAGTEHGKHLVVVTDAREIAGAELALAQLIANTDASVRVTVASVDSHVGTWIAEHRESAEVVPLAPLATKTDILNLWRVYSTLRQLAPMALHLNKAEVGGLRYFEALAMGVRGVKVVSVVHHVERPGSGLSRILSRLLARRADAIVAVGQNLARELEQILGLPDGRVATIHNALDDSGEISPPAPDRAGSRPFTACTLTRMVAHKRVADVVSAAAAVEDLHLILAGDGPDLAALKAQTEALGIADRVEFPGWVSAPSVLGRSDVYVLASEIEGFPMALLQAQKAGLPVIGSNVGGVPEMVEHGVSGYLFEPGDVEAIASSLHKLKADESLRLAMAEAAVEASAERPGPRAMARSYEALYWPDDEQKKQRL